ncbi:hypothetical protein WN944_007357 [Citrus x changshan-huyou]|uniref:superoxide dismutase n=1 Tax=Citrus x changshan-huyou TaxID=2935761 RepID=A0AAP0MMT2_9ROSI
MERTASIKLVALLAVLFCPTTIKGTLYYLSQGAHGFHIHVYGDMAHFCQSTGDHFNPFRKHHGGPEDWIRHAGDLGNIYVGFDVGNYHSKKNGNAGDKIACGVIGLQA